MAPDIIDPTIRDMYEGMDNQSFACKLYAARTVAHRLRKFGFEEHINQIDPRDMLLIAHFCEPYQKYLLMKEAFSKIPGGDKVKLEYNGVLP